MDSATQVINNTVIPGFVAAIGILWRYVMKHHKKMEKQLENCEKKHDEHNAVILELTREIGDLKEVKGRIDGIEFLAKKVLEAVGGEVDGNGHD